MDTNEPDFTSWGVDVCISDTATHLLFFAIDLVAENWFRIGGEWELRKDGEVADVIGTAGVVGVWKIDTNIEESGLEVFEIAWATNFGNAEDIGLSESDDFEELGYLKLRFTSDFTFASDGAPHGKVVTEVVGNEGVWRVRAGDSSVCDKFCLRSDRRCRCCSRVLPLRGGGDELALTS